MRSQRGNIVNKEFSPLDSHFGWVDCGHFLSKHMRMKGIRNVTAIEESFLT